MKLCKFLIYGVFVVIFTSCGTSEESQPMGPNISYSLLFSSEDAVGVITDIQVVGDTLVAISDNDIVFFNSTEELEYLIFNMSLNEYESIESIVSLKDTSSFLVLSDGEILYSLKTDSLIQETLIDNSELIEDQNPMGPNPNKIFIDEDKLYFAGESIYESFLSEILESPTLGRRIFNESSTIVYDIASISQNSAGSLFGCFSYGGTNIPNVDPEDLLNLLEDGVFTTNDSFNSETFDGSIAGIDVTEDCTIFSGGDEKFYLAIGNNIYILNDSLTLESSITTDATYISDIKVTSDGWVFYKNEYSHLKFFSNDVDTHKRLSINIDGFSYTLTNVNSIGNSVVLSTARHLVVLEKELFKSEVLGL